MDYLTQTGADISKLKFKYFNEDNYGFYSNKKIDYGESCCHFTPEKAMIGIERSFHTETLGGVEKAREFMSKKELRKDTSYWTVLVLEAQKKEDSPIKPFVDILPTNYKEYPVNFTEAELESLKGSGIINWINNRKNNI